MQRIDQAKHRRPKEDATGGMPIPEAPTTAGRAPQLTSIHATPGRGPYGDPRYRGNCSGLLIRDLLAFFRPRRVLDPMEGGGTCRDVCESLGIRYEGRDLLRGFDATRPEDYRGLGVFDFIWWHPPYWQMVRYNGDDARCLSNASTVRDFIAMVRTVIRNLDAVLEDDGKLAILIGDGKHDGKYLGLPFRMMSAAAREGYWLAAPEIIRFGFGASSARKEYSGRFIPRVHDVCLVLEKVPRRTG